MNKPKIDLKARLGKRPGGTPASASIPPPVGVNPGPPSAANPMMGGGMASGHVGHPGAYPSAQPQRPSFDAMGVGAVQAPAPIRAPVTQSAAEAEEEFRAVRQSGRTKTMVLAAGTAVVGGILGFAIGGLSERNSVAEVAVLGSKQLSADIDAANKKVVELEQVVTAAGKALKDGKYPENEVKALGGLNVPFDGTNLAGKGIGRFKPQVLTMLINYAEAVAKVNTQKDKIRSVLSVSKPAVEDLLTQNTTPQVRWGLTVQSTPQGPWGILGPLPAAFPVSGGWPAQIELGEEKRGLKRYSGGDASGQLIPIAPQSHNAVCPNDTMTRLRREVGDLDKLMLGDKTPGQETDGIVEMGDAIRKQLAAIGG
ncbi:MAG: hypothetical protein RL685_361 [Pseudomonadota bacterium]